MNCPYCNNEIPYNVSSCPACGAPVTPQAPPPGYGQQPYGQQPQQTVVTINGMPSTPAKSRMVFILLAIFLGEFGVHNFYAGRTGLGAIQLGISVISCMYASPVSWIWAVIEACTVTADANGVPFN